MNVSLPTAPPASPSTAASPPTPSSTQPAAPPRVVIAGAGPAGMATALELANRGVRSTVIEARPGPGTRENLFNVLPPFADALSRLDPSGSLTRALDPTSSVRFEDRASGRPAQVREPGPGSPGDRDTWGNIGALLAAMGPANATGADNRPWHKVGIGDLENAMRELARTKHADLIELRPGTVEAVHQGSDWAEAVVNGPDGTRDAVRGAFLVDATGRDLLGADRMVYPERMHWMGGRFAAPADGNTEIHRVRERDPATGSLSTKIKLPSRDRTFVWMQSAVDPKTLTPEQRTAELEAGARAMGVEGGLVEGASPAPVIVQLSVTTEPANGRVFKVGDSNRAPYFPTSSGAAAAIVHDAPRAAVAISRALAGESLDHVRDEYVHAVLGASELLAAASRRQMLNDLGIKPEDAQPAVRTSRSVPQSAPASPVQA